MPRPKQKNKIVIGLTGSFGSGKSTVAGIFSSYGAAVIDADKIARGCFNRGKKIYKKVILAFGNKILGADKNIDRHKLAKIVFNNKKLLGKLNNIVHPEIIRIVRSKISSKKKGVMVLDAPLLLEAGLQNAVDFLVVVTLDKDKQFSRLIKKTSLKKADIAKRIKYQIPLRAKARLADFIIDNNGSLKNTRKQVAQIRRKLWKS